MCYIYASGLYMYVCICVAEAARFTTTCDDNFLKIRMRQAQHRLHTHSLWRHVQPQLHAHLFQIHMAINTINHMAGLSLPCLYAA